MNTKAAQFEEYLNPINSWTTVVTYEEPTPQGSPFPNVTVCNMNWVPSALQLKLFQMASAGLEINMTRLKEADGQLEGLLWLRDLTDLGLTPSESYFAGRAQRYRDQVRANISRKFLSIRKMSVRHSDIERAATGVLALRHADLGPQRLLHHLPRLPEPGNWFET